MIFTIFPSAQSSKPLLIPPLLLFIELLQCSLHCSKYFHKYNLVLMKWVLSVTPSYRQGKVPSLVSNGTKFHPSTPTPEFIVNC